MISLEVGDNTIDIRFNNTDLRDDYFDLIGEILNPKTLKYPDPFK